MNSRNGGWAIRCVGEMVFRFRRDIPPMSRQAHLEAAKHHLEAASKHLEAAGKYKDGEDEEADKFSEEAQTASRLADGKSTEAHWQSRKAANEREALSGAARTVARET